METKIEAEKDSVIKTMLSDLPTVMSYHIIVICKIKAPSFRLGLCFSIVVHTVQWTCGRPYFQVFILISYHISTFISVTGCYEV